MLAAKTGQADRTRDPRPSFSSTSVRHSDAFNSPERSSVWLSRPLSTVKNSSVWASQPFEFTKQLTLHISDRFRQIGRAICAGRLAFVQPKIAAKKNPAQAGFSRPDSERFNFTQEFATRPFFSTSCVSTWVIAASVTIANSRLQFANSTLARANGTFLSLAG